MTSRLLLVLDWRLRVSCEYVEYTTISHVGCKPWNSASAMTRLCICLDRAQPSDLGYIASSPGSITHTDQLSLWCMFIPKCTQMYTPGLSFRHCMIPRSNMLHMSDTLIIIAHSTLIRSRYNLKRQHGFNGPYLSHLHIHLHLQSHD